MRLKILHVGAWNRNYGDLVLQQAIMHGIRAEAAGPVGFLPIDCQRTHFDGPLVGRVTRIADGVWVGGGGLVFHRPEDRSVSGWQFNIGEAQLAELGVPLVVWGIGYNQFAFTNAPLPEHTGRHLRAVWGKAAFFSARDHGSAERIAALMEVPPEDIRITPDSGIFCPPGPPLGIREALGWPDGPIIALNWAGDRPEQRYRAPDEERRALAALLDVLRDMVDRFDARVLLVPHIHGIDDTVEGLVQSALGKRAASVAALIPGWFPPLAEHASTLGSVYREADLVLGMRGHANLIAFGQGTPFVPIGDHPKNRFFLGTLERYRPPVLAMPSEREFDRNLAREVLGGILNEPATYEAQVAEDLQLQERQHAAAMRAALGTIQNA